MKNDFTVQRVVPTPDRTVQYRSERQRAGVDIVRSERQEAHPVAAAQPKQGAVVAAPVQETVKPVTPLVPPASESQAVDEKAPRVQKKNRKSLRFVRPVAGTLGVLLILGITGYVALDTYLANNVVRKTTYSDMAVRGDSTAVEGADETVIEPNAIDSYKVAADMPRVLSISKIGVKARILPMGVTTTSAVQAPVNIFDSGWYNGSAKPGTPGVAFIDGHASGATREGLFAYIDTLVAGDTFTIERGDGSVLTYAVREVEKIPLADIDMAKLLSPHGDIKEGVTLMTCTGKWQADKKTYDQRAVVYAERIS